MRKPMNKSARPPWYPPASEALPRPGAPLRELIQFAARHDPTPLFRERWGESYAGKALDLWHAHVTAFRNGLPASGGADELLMSLNYVVAAGLYSGAGQPDPAAFLAWLVDGLRRSLPAPPDASSESEQFGCLDCWPAGADAAWEARRALRVVTGLVDESHVRVTILKCPRCGQEFLSIFTELIDWKNGDDSQDWTRLPLTEPEAAELSNQRESLTELILRTLGPGRRCLRRVYPSGGGQTLFWGTGIFIGMHD